MGSVRLLGGALAGAVVTGALLLVPAPLAPAAATAATTISARLLGPLVTVLPSDHPVGTDSLTLRAQPGEIESFQVAVSATAGSLAGAAVAVDDLSGPGGASIGGNDVTVFREAYTRVWTPSDQEGWCPYFTDPDDGGTGPVFTCGIPATETPDGSWENSAWKCGGAVRPVLTADRCLFPDALVPERDSFYGEDRNAFPMAVPAGENRMAWIDVNVPASAAPGTYSTQVRVSATGQDPVLLPVSLVVSGPTLPAAGADAVVGLDGGVNVNPELCNAHACGSNAETFRLMHLYTRASLENRMPILDPALVSSPYGGVAGLFDTWVRPLVTGAAGPSADGLLPARQPGARVPLVVLNQHYDAADWRVWQTYATTHGFADRMRFYCDELYTKPLFEAQCADPYARAVGTGGWQLDQGDLPSVLIGGQAQEDIAHEWGDYAVLDHEKTRIPIINHLHPKGEASTRGVYDAPGGFLHGRPDRTLWTYNSNGSLGAGLAWTPHQFWNGWPVLGGVDQPAVSELASAITAWMYRTSGHYYYDGFNRLAQAWNDCSTGAACLYSSFGGHGDGTLYYPGTVARIGGTHAIPVESMRLKRYRDGAETFSLLRQLETGCEGDCPGITRAQLAAIIGDPGTGGGLFARASATDVPPAAYDAARGQLLDLLPDAPPPPPPTVPQVSIGDANVVEGDGPGQAVLVFAVTRTGDLSAASSARFTMTYDTATYDVDVGYPFSPTEDTPDHVHLAPGVATAQVRAVVRPDTEVEADETVTLTLSEPVNAALVDAVATGTVLDDDQAVPPPVRRGVDLALRGGGPWRGDGVVNGTGAGQTLAKRTPRGRAARFSVRLKNTGSGIDGVALATALSGTPYRVRYLVGSRDVTAQVRSGSWTTGPLAAGAARVITVVVKVPRRARIGAARRVVLKGTSQQGGQGRRDVVALVVRARR